MPDSIPITCPSCGASFSVLAQFAGAKIKCPKCKAASIRVPGEIGPPPVQVETPTDARIAEPAQAATPFAQPKRGMSAAQMALVAGAVVTAALMVTCGGCLVLATKATRDATARVRAERQAQDTARATPKTPEQIAEQEKSREFVQGLIEKRLATKFVWSGDTLQFWATRDFLRGNFDGKQTICGAVYAYAKGVNDDAWRVELIESTNGKRVGEYLPERGLRID